MIIFSRNTLREALTGLRVLKLNKHPLPFLQHVLVIGFENRVQFDGTNLDQYLRYEGEAQTTAATRLLVPFEVLENASKTAEANAQIRITGGEEPRISYGVGSATLDTPFKTLNVAEFPEKPVAENEPIALPAGILGAMNEALGCASTDETRYVLNSVYLDAHAVVATDGRQLYRRNSLDLPITEGAIFPASPVPGILPDEAAQLWRWYRKEHPYAQITVGRWTWITKLVEGDFPNYQHVIPKADSYGGLVRLSEADAERIKTVIPKMPGFKEKDSPVILRVTDKGAELRTLSRLPQVHLSLERSEVVRTATTDVAFNARLLLGALQRGMRELHARDHMSPVMMTESNRVHVWMPLQGIVVPRTVATAEPASGDAKPETETPASDPSSESSVPVVPREPAVQVPAVRETNVSETITHNTDTTMVATATTQPVSKTRENAGNPGAVAPRVAVSETPVSAADAIQEKLQRIRDLLRDLKGEIGGMETLLRDSARQYKALERDHETLRKNIRALREVPV